MCKLPVERERKSAGELVKLRQVCDVFGWRVTPGYYLSVREKQVCGGALGSRHLASYMLRLNEHNINHFGN